MRLYMCAFIYAVDKMLSLLKKKLFKYLKGQNLSHEIFFKNLLINLNKLCEAV